MSLKYTTATFMKFECDSCLCAIHLWEDQTSALPVGPSGPRCLLCRGTLVLSSFGPRSRPATEAEGGK